jgi:hypothetical protein
MKNMTRIVAVAVVAGCLFLGSASAARAQCAVAVPVYFTPPPVVSYSAPVVTYKPTVSYYYTPKVSYYAAPSVSYYAVPTTSYYAVPTTSYYAAPAGATATTTTYGLFGRPKSTTTYYYPPAVLVP